MYPTTHRNASRFEPLETHAAIVTFEKKESMSKPVITTRHKAGEGNIFQITINRPDVYNCVNGETASLLLEAWRNFRGDDSLTVTVLHGAGDRSFCSGQIFLR